MTESITSDSVRFYRPPLMPGVELVSVRYRERSFPDHSHSEYVVGAIVAGAERLTVAGRSYRVDTGNVLLLHPDEAHANATIGSDVLRYDVLYLREDTMASYVDRARNNGALRFDLPVSGDPTLLAIVSAAHAVLSSDATGRLEQESALGALVRALDGKGRGIPDMAGSQAVPAARIADAKAYIDENYADGFGPHDLAALSGLSC